MTPRQPVIDIARSVALLGMVTFHSVFDLTLFGHLPPGTSQSFGWALFARIVAGSFLFLAGVSLVLAHGPAIRFRAFARRLAMVVAAAALVTAGTRAAMPDSFVFYGILHSIAVSSLLGLAVLRWPAVALLICAAVVFALPDLVRFEALNPRGLAWIGLAAQPPVSVDFVPLFPWLAPFLAGMAGAKLLNRHDLWPRLALADTPLVRKLAWPGRHSLAIYLIHQPVIFGLIWVATWALRQG